MKTILFLLLAQTVVCQEFIVTIHVENALGERDSVQIGYDDQATRDIDTLFGEVDISAIPFADHLDVRVGQVHAGFLGCDENNLNDDPQLLTHLSKIDINPNNCQGWENFIPLSTLFLKDNNFPIKITWKSEIFQDECLDGSFISDWLPGGWFDVSCGGEFVPFILLANTNEVIIESRTGIYMVDTFLDTLSMFHLPLAPKRLLNNVEEQSLDQVTLYPNPTTGIVNVEGMKASKVQVYTVSGQLVSTSTGAVNLNQLSYGIYFVRLTDSEGHSVLKKVVKKD